MKRSTRPDEPTAIVSPIRHFALKYPLAGPLMWISTVQYFLVQVMVAAAWGSNYSWTLNAISDLGATSCGEFDGRYVCSPLAGVMNASLILLGLAMLVGSVLIYQELCASRTAFTLMAVAGIGAILVGLFPEDTVFWAHIAGADLAFLLGNIAVIVFGFSLRMPRWLRCFSVASGSVALVALVLFLSHNRSFLGLGGMERLTAYPQTIWLIVFGVWMLAVKKRRVTV